MQEEQISGRKGCLAVGCVAGCKGEAQSLSAAALTDPENGMAGVPLFGNTGTNITETFFTRPVTETHIVNKYEMITLFQSAIPIKNIQV